ncbi:MAG: histidine phosphatase family protein [Oscillospiraceae bacterium]
MTNLYIVRHVESTGNVKRCFQGCIDNNVTENGINQADCLAEYFCNIKLDVVYTSPLKRAFITADNICNKKDLTPIIDDRIKEIDGGNWEGKKIHYLKKNYPEDFDVWCNSPWNFGVESSEKMTEVFDRTKSFLQDILYKHDNILIVSHGWTIRNILCNALGLDIYSLNRYNFINNASVSLINIDNDQKKLVYFNKGIFKDDE